MQNIQELFHRLREKKREQRELNASLRDALRASGEYRHIVDELDRLKTKKRQIEMSIRADFESQMDLLKLDIKGGTQALSDAALTQLMRGEKIELKDENEQAYDPVFSVRFQKAQ